MFCGKCSNNLTMKTLRYLKSIYKTQTETYWDLLHVNGKADIHTQTIQLLMIEIYKYLNKLSPPFTWITIT